MGAIVEPKDRLIYALDFADEQSAKKEIDRVYPLITFYKLGLELFLASGWSVIDYILSKKDGRVMLDLKLFDIPATIAGAVRQVENHGGISLLTIHGRKQTIRAAIEARQDDRMKIIGVTVLTSFAQEDLEDLDDPNTLYRLRNDSKRNLKTAKIEDLVRHRAKITLAAGADGLVASALEAKMLRQELGSQFGDKWLLVTPGIRLAVVTDPLIGSGIDKDDQRRVARPQEAVSWGADYLVIGRPIRESKDPSQTIKSMAASISGT